MAEEYFFAVGARGGGSSQYLLGRGRMHTSLRAHIDWSTSDVKGQGTHGWRHPWRSVKNIQIIFVHVKAFCHLLALCVSSFKHLSCRWEQTFRVVVESYLGLFEGGLSSDVDEDVDGGRRSEEDEEDLISREPGIPTTSQSITNWLLILQKKHKILLKILKIIWRKLGELSDELLTFCWRSYRASHTRCSQIGCHTEHWMSAVQTWWKRWKNSTIKYNKYKDFISSEMYSDNNIKRFNC